MNNGKAVGIFMIFFIADTHFDDVNILHYENRPFKTVEEMNGVLIENWNRTVGKEDTVYFLGDIGAEQYVKQLNGKKILIKGNHDIKDNNSYRMSGFAEVYELPVILDEFWIMSHEPMYVNENMPYANVFGHVHNNPMYRTVSPQSYCVSVERIGYTPILFEDVKRAVQGYHDE